MTGKFVAYYRVSTQKQGESGLGLEAQQAAVRDYLNGSRWKLVGEFKEVESGAHNDRTELAKAMNLAKLTGARLIIAKLDRLSRNAAFLLALRDSGVDFVCADMPDATKLTIGILALVAENERDMISARTKAALGAAKARGKVLGGWRPTKRDGTPRKPANLEHAWQAHVEKAVDFAARVGPIVREMRAGGMSLHKIAAELTAQGIETARGGAWTATAVRNVLARL